jgi:predicted DNA-binding transcriptional regulator YafY
MRRTQRLFAITEYLRGRRTGVTAEVLAERFGVTVRTIYRDLDALRDADLPLGAERGRGGGYALDRNYTLPPVNFTAREAALLTAIGQHAIDMRLLPFQATLQRLTELAFVGVPALPSAPNVRAAVERAWFEERALRLTYVDGDHVESTREVRLRQVIMHRHETRLDVEDLASGERRQLRLDRITRAALLRINPP